MTFIEHASLDLSSAEAEEQEKPGGAFCAHRACEQILPHYHEDSGEYVSGVNGVSTVSAETFPKRLQSRSRLRVIHAEENLGSPRSTLDVPQACETQVSEAAEDACEKQVPLENASKNDIKAYLASTVFRCANARDSEALSEYAYAPTDKGSILSVEKPFSNTNFKRMKALLSRRVKPSRFAHSVMVAQTAEKMAFAYGVDARVARIAGLLHDWDKALSPKRLRDRVEHYQLDIDGQTQINMPHLLHGPTAAAVLADEFPEFGAEVFQAIDRHTVGGIPMTPLDMIVFCADKLEPGNDVPVYRELYDQIGAMDLRDLFLAVQREGLIYLLRSGRPLNVDAVEVWNYYCAERQRDNE